MDRRMDFRLPEADQSYMDETYPGWEAVINPQRGNERWVLIHDYTLPPGYQVEAATIALLIPAGYPRDQIDMAYFFPPLSLADRATQPKALTMRVIDGKNFQQWSRHRTQIKWRPFKDNVNSHLAYVDSWLKKEAGV